MRERSSLPPGACSLVKEADNKKTTNKQEHYRLLGPREETVR